MKRSITAVRNGIGVKGFTMIELIVVLALITTILTFGSIAAAPFSPGFRLASAGRQVATDLRLTRTKAIHENRRFKAVFTDGANTYSVQREDVYLSGVWSEHALYGKGLAEASTVAMALPEQVSANAAEITFDPRGSATSATVTLRHASAPGLRTVTVDLTGVVTLQ
jgi:prepilin-type N-terminal cleavage/methylation domain-containing protein